MSSLKPATPPTAPPVAPVTAPQACAVCRDALAPWGVFNPHADIARLRYCSLHVPENFGLPKSPQRAFEEAFLALAAAAQNETPAEGRNLVGAKNDASNPFLQPGASA